MVPTANFATRRATDTSNQPDSRPELAFPAYERLQQGDGDVTLQAILNENPMLGLTVAQEINLGSVEIIDLAIDPSNGVLTDLRLRLRGRGPTHPFRRSARSNASESELDRNTLARAAMIRRVASSDPVTSDDWAMHMLVRELQDMYSALDARIGSEDTWGEHSDDGPAAERADPNQPTRLVWDEIGPAGRAQLAEHDGSPRGWMRVLILLGSLRRAINRSLPATGRGTVPTSARASSTRRSTLPLRDRVNWFMPSQPEPR